MVEMRLSDRTVLRAHAVSDSRPLQNQRTTWRLDVFAVNYVRPSTAQSSGNSTNDGSGPGSYWPSQSGRSCELQFAVLATTRRSVARFSSALKMARTGISNA